MDGWHYIVISLGIILALFTCWQEVARRNKKYLLLRVLSVIVCAACLVCLALNITYTRIVKAADTAVILTDGYNKDSTTIFTETQNIPAYTFDDLLLPGKTYKTIHVFGYGLSADNLQQLQNAQVVFHPQAVGTGITFVNWKQALQTGEQLRIQGTFNNNGTTPVKLLLSGLNTSLDSINISPGNTRFQLTTAPKQAGKAIYSLTALVDNKVVEEELVPVEVNAADSLRVLILSSSPDFENRFLKSWLSENNCAVTVRSTTSKDKYDRSFLNTASSGIGNITTSTLAAFDVVISDASEFAALSKDEQNAVQSKVSDGMGLIIKADTTLPASSFYAQYFPVYSQPAKPQQVSLQLTGGKALHALPAYQPLYIRSLPGNRATVKDSSSQALVNSTVYGMGKIAVTTINNTYNWVLAGNKDDYYTFWSDVLSQVTKNQTAQQDVSFNPAFAIVNQPLHITFTGNTNPQPVIAGSTLSLAQQVNLPFKWDGIYWPAQTGWQTIKTQNDSTNFYVYNKDDWRYVQATANTNATNEYVLHQKSAAPGVETTANEEVPMPKIYFIIGLLLCCTFLWIERKFNG